LRDLPERYGSWKTGYSRFGRWEQQGIWDQVFTAPIAKAHRRGDLDWELHHIDSTVMRAHQHAAGARKMVIKTPPPASS
jgi:transposase